MILTHRITHYTGTFSVRLVRSVIQFNHGPQDTSLYRLQAVPHIRKSTGNDNGHRIIDIRFFHRLFKIHFLNFVKYLIVHINSYPLKTVHLRHSVPYNLLQFALREPDSQYPLPTIPLRNCSLITCNYSAPMKYE